MWDFEKGSICLEKAEQVIDSLPIAIEDTPPNVPEGCCGTRLKKQKSPLLMAGVIKRTSRLTE